MTNPKPTTKHVGQRLRLRHQGASPLRLTVLKKMLSTMFLTKTMTASTTNALRRTLTRAPVKAPTTILMKTLTHVLTPVAGVSADDNSDEEPEGLDYLAPFRPTIGAVNFETLSRAALVCRKAVETRQLQTTYTKMLSLRTSPALSPRIQCLAAGT